MSSPPDSKAPRGLRVIALAVLGLAAVVAVGWVVSQWGVRGAIERGISVIRAAGPVPFFAAMALVPAPLSWFTIPAGEAFAATMTLPGVIAAALAAVAVQIAFCYWLARFAFRPAIQRWMARRGRVVPVVSADNALAVVLLVRLVPGPPLFLQCFLLGLAEVPFALYLIVSWLITVPWVIGGVVLGRGILDGNWGLAVAGVSVLGLGALGLHTLRRRRAVSAAS